MNGRIEWCSKPPVGRKLYTLKGSFPTVESAFKVMYLAVQEQENKWNMSSIRNWYEIYPQ